MSLGGFTLADRLGARTVPCRVSGCTRTWVQLSNKALSLAGPGADDPNDPGNGMCEPCRSKLKQLRDQERPCDRPGCGNTWPWPVAEQLQAFATKRQPPRALCGECSEKLAGLESKEVACTVPSCTRTAVLSPRQQLLAEAPTPARAHQDASEGGADDRPDTTTEAGAEVSGPKPDSPPGGKNGKNGNKRDERRGVTVTGPLCAPCAEVVPRIKDRAVGCGIHGCSRKWTWRADEQIQYFAAGRPPEPPRRMCDACRAEFGKLLDREVRCRTSGCKKTWTWSRFDQLDACVAGKPAPKAPQQMCQSCFDTFQNVKDVERPCRRSGCKGTWLDKRGAQLARAVRGKAGDPYPRYCPSCERELGDLGDREVACKTDGCSGTWTWSKEQQLAAGVRPKKMIEAEAEEAREAARAAETPAVTAAPAQPGGAPEAHGPQAGEDDGEDAAEAGATHAPATDGPVGAPAAAQGNKKKRRRNKKRREPQPPERRCSACAEFLSSKKTMEIPCGQCQTPIYWPPESQLQTHLGNWAMPGLCGACKRDGIEAARLAAREVLRAQHGAPSEAASPPALTTSEASAEVPDEGQSDGAAATSETAPASE